MFWNSFMVFLLSDFAVSPITLNISRFRKSIIKFPLFPSYFSKKFEIGAHALIKVKSAVKNHRAFTPYCPHLAENLLSNKRERRFLMGGYHLAPPALLDTKTIHLQLERRRSLFSGV